jgi:hypothetical protein
MVRRITRSSKTLSCTPPPTASPLVIDGTVSGDSIDSDWEQESDGSSDDGSSLVATLAEDSESNDEIIVISDHDSEDRPLAASVIKDEVQTENDHSLSNSIHVQLEQQIPKQKKKRKPSEPPVVWHAPSDLDELDICSDLEILNAGPRKRKYNVESKIRVLHPEIGTVWRDLKQKSLDFTLDSNQPNDVTLKLLPFQLEGVSWLKHQEEGNIK